MKRWLLPPQTWVEFGIAVLIVLIARGTAVVAVNWMGDDYAMISDPSGSANAAANISMLRYPVAMAFYVSHWFGVVHPALGTFWNVLNAVATVAFGLALRHFWLPGSAASVGVITALIFSLFPSHANLYSYHMMNVAMIMNYGLAAFALISCARGGWFTALSVVAIALALGYQTMLSLFLVAGLLLPLFAFTMLPADPALARTEWRRRINGVVRYFLVLLAGVLLYYVLGKLMLVLVGSGESARTTLAGAELLSQKLSLITAHLKRLLAGNGEPSLPVRIKGLQLLLLANACLAWLLTRVPLPAPLRSAWLRSVLLILLLLLAAISILVPTVLLVRTQENPRNLIATAVFWSGIFCLACSARPLLFRRSALILGALIALAYTIITNTISVDYTRLIQRQHLLASRMVERLSQQPGFATMRTVVVLGSSPDLRRDLRSTDLVWPSLDSYIASAVLREVSGTPLQAPSPADEQAAKAESRGMDSWPAPASTAIKGDMGIVVLQRSP